MKKSRLTYFLPVELILNSSEAEFTAELVYDYEIRNGAETVSIQEVTFWQGGDKLELPDWLRDLIEQDIYDEDLIDHARELLSKETL